MTIREFLCQSLPPSQVKIDRPKFAPNWTLALILINEERSA